jgi:hypothetical protein
LFGYTPTRSPGGSHWQAPGRVIFRYSQGAIADNKRLGAALAFIRDQQLRREPLKI